MVSLFRRTRGDELELLRSTVGQLGETTVDGLATALGWRRRPTERWLAEELRRPGTPLVFDPGQGTVRWAVEEGPAEAPRSFDPAPAVPRIAPLAPPPAPEAELPPIRGSCSSCHVPLHPATNGAFAVCPRCGRLSSRRSLEVASSPPAAPSPTPSEGGAPRPAEDRRLQEMLAAYVTSQPILCPRCRTPLRHRSLAEYVCPTCGREVRFPGTPPTGVAVRGSGTSPAASARPPAEPAVAPMPGRFASVEPAGRPERGRADPPPSSGRPAASRPTEAPARAPAAPRTRRARSVPGAPRPRTAPSSHPRAPASRPRAPTRAHR